MRIVVPQSGIVIMLEELVAVVAENLRLRGDMAERTGSWPRCPAGSRRQRPRRRGVRAERGERIRMLEARHAAELAERDERIRMLEAGLLSSRPSFHPPPRPGPATAFIEPARYARQ